MSAQASNSPTATLAVNGAIASLYALLGLVSTTVAAGPGGMPLFWLPAGFAVATLVTMPWRQSLAGIVAGALLTSAAAHASVGLDTASLSIAAAMAAGATAQALAAALLQRRFAAFHWAELGLRGRARALALLRAVAAAAAVATIDAGLGAAALTLGGQLAPALAPAVWATAWLGNTLGILLVAPPMIYTGARIQLMTPAQRSALMVIDVGIILSAASFFLLRSLETTPSAAPEPTAVMRHPLWVPWGALLAGIAVTLWVASTIARRHEDAEALRRSEERFRALIEKSANAIALLNAEGRIVYESPNYERVMGYEPGSRLGASALQLVHPDDATYIADLLGNVIGTPGLSRTAVFRARHHDGSWHWLESTGTNQLADPAVAGIIVNVRDINDYKLAEQALRESEARLRTILQTALDGFWIVDQHQRFIDVNEAYCAMSGYSREEILAMRISDIEALEQPEETDARIRAIVARGTAQFETRHRCKDGSLIDVEVSVHYIASGGGQLVCFCRTIGERKRREEEIQRLNSDLELRVAERTADLSQVNAELHRALRAKDEFLAIMSHELRTPLNSILAFSELLGEQFAGPLNERQLRSVQHIDTSGRHLLALINDILDLSKIEAGRMEIHIEPCSIADICDASLLFIKELAIKKSLKIGFSYSADVDTIEVDAKRLKQMLVNLLSNAVKFTPAAGRVGLAVSADAELDVVRFAVEDNGIGIAPEQMGRLFTPFTQLDSGLTRQHEGTGLGLALVRRLADLHGGSVTIESAGAGQGSRFTLSLPRTQPSAPPPVQVEPPTPLAPPLAPPRPAAPSAPPRPSQLQGARILLADDNETTISVISDYLQHRGYSVVVARNGHEALARAAEAPPDLILMDIQMPVLDGLAATRALRAQPTFAATPIVALTALAMTGDRERCLEAGANEYLSKPVSLRQLVELIERMLSA